MANEFNQEKVIWSTEHRERHIKGQPGENGPLTPEELYDEFHPKQYKMPDGSIVTPTPWKAFRIHDEEGNPTGEIGGTVERSYPAISINQNGHYDLKQQETLKHFLNLPANGLDQAKTFLETLVKNGTYNPDNPTGNCPQFGSDLEKQIWNKLAQEKYSVETIAKQLGCAEITVKKASKKWFSDDENLRNLHQKDE